MERLTITIYQDDSIQDVLERVQFILNEMGIRMNLLESDSEAVIYSFIRAERLNDAQEES